MRVWVERGQRGWGSRTEGSGSGFGVEEEGGSGLGSSTPIHAQKKKKGKLETTSMVVETKRRKRMKRGKMEKAGTSGNSRIFPGRDSSICKYSSG